MRILIFGATGKLGRRVVTEGIRRGHRVTAFIRRPETLPIVHPNVRMVFGDIYDRRSVDQAMPGHAAVISTLGMPLFGRRLICRDGMAAVIPAMQRHSVRRLIAISAFGAREYRNFNVYTRHLRWLIPNHMDDKDAMEELIRSSGLSWTMLRPAAYFDLWPDHRYVVRERISHPYPFVPRQAVARCLLDVLERNQYIQQAMAIEWGSR